MFIKCFFCEIVHAYVRQPLFNSHLSINVIVFHRLKGFILLARNTDPIIAQ